MTKKMDVWGQFNLENDTIKDPKEIVKEVKEKTKELPIIEQEKAVEEALEKEAQKNKEKTKEFDPLVLLGGRTLGAKIRIRKTVELDRDVNAKIDDIVAILNSKNMLLLDGEKPTRSNLINYVLRKYLYVSKEGKKHGGNN